MNCWEAWRLAKTYQCKPSQIYGIEDSVAAWCFDRAIYLFGSTMQLDLDNAGNGAKNPSIANGRKQQVMAKWLGIEAQYRSVGQTSPQTVESSSGGTVKL